MMIFVSQNKPVRSVGVLYKVVQRPICDYIIYYLSFIFHILYRAVSPFSYCQFVTSKKAEKQRFKKGNK